MPSAWGSLVIPVVWWGLNPDAIARGYWDQGMIEAILGGTLWPTDPPQVVSHRECRVDASTRDGLREIHRLIGAGAVVVIPARHHAVEPYLSQTLRAVETMPWALVVLTGDEAGEFPVERIVRMSRVCLWVMSPQPGRSYGDGTRLIGSGWPPGIREHLAALPIPEKQVPYAFLGQLTHERRRDAWAMLNNQPDAGEATLVGSEGFTLGIPQADYWSALADARVAPCPSGPVSPDSFRVYEALEAGCIPLADDVAPGCPNPGYWSRVLGPVPFPRITDSWLKAGPILDSYLADWPRNASDIFAAWQQEKRRMTLRFWDDLEESGGPPAPPAAPIGVLIVTSPTPKHPEIDDLAETVLSVRAQLPYAEIVIVFDGVAPQLEHRVEAYREYTRRALWWANHQPGVLPVVLGSWHHQAGATRIGLEEVRSPLLLFVEHDTPLTGEIDWAAVVETFEDGHLDMLRFHHETEVGEYHRHMMLDPEPRVESPAPFLRTYQWSQRPHVASVGWYRRILDRHFAPDARAMIEDVMHGIVTTAWLDWGLAGWSRYRLGIYYPEGNIQRSLHLDSRRRVVGDPTTEDPKPAQRFSYPGDAPPGAPGTTPWPTV